MRKNKEKAAARARFPQYAKKTLTLIVLLGTFALSAALGILWKYGRGLPDYQFLASYKPPTISRIYDRFGNQIQELAEERRIYAHLSDIPPLLVRAVISAEDKNYYSHCGIDILGIIKAAILNTTKKRWKTAPIGGSTITQQVAKIFLVGNEHSFSRKIKEAILALRLESALSKDKILELYLNQIYLGAGSYGVVMAAKIYFNKPLQELTLPDCAFLASLPKAPSHQHPLRNPERALERRNWVLSKMYKNNVIFREQCEQAAAAPLGASFYFPPPYPRNYYLDEARRELIRFFGEKNTYTAGIEATLTIHPQIQALTEKSLRCALETYDERKGWRGPVASFAQGEDWEETWALSLQHWDLFQDISLSPAVVLKTEEPSGGKKDILVGLPNKTTEILQPNIFSPSAFPHLKRGDVVFVRKKERGWELAQIPLITGGMVALDAATGEILGLSGGYSYNYNQFNCATQAFRQPGSTFKPFVYLAALQKGYKASSVFVERPTRFWVAGTHYVPHNYKRDLYGGPMPLELGLIKSHNVLTVILADKIGIPNVTTLAQSLGVADYIPNHLFVALGSAETTVLKLAGAYCPFFNGGKKVKPALFLNITNSFGDAPLTWSQEPPRFFLKKEHAQAMKSMLKGCVERGTARRLRPLTETFPIHLYGKTGTSNDFKDAWFVGCVELKENAPQEQTLLTMNRPLVFAIFMGYPFPRSLGEDEFGGKVTPPAIETFVQSLFP
ncbi:penicillin-binding protein [Alphaproteobacteria bacterium]|nr:penicillin-binding protein [Alphaproteobacteria bacterium]